jgi:hypothetical protein
MNENVYLIISCILAVLLLISEYLPATSKLKANSIFQVVMSVVKFLSEKIFPKK